ERYANARRDRQHISNIELHEGINVADRRGWDIDGVHRPKLEIVLEVPSEHVLYIHDLVAAVLADHDDLGRVRGVDHACGLEYCPGHRRRMGIDEGTRLLDLAADKEPVGCGFDDDEIDPVNG